MNSRPPPCHGGALPAELQPQIAFTLYQRIADNSISSKLHQSKDGYLLLKKLKKLLKNVNSVFNEVMMFYLARLRRFERPTFSLGVRYSIH